LVIFKRPYLPATHSAGSTGSWYAEELVFLIDQLVGGIENSCPIGTELQAGRIYVAIVDKLAIESHRRASTARHAVKFKDIIGLLIGVIDHARSIGAESLAARRHVAAVRQRGVEPYRCATQRGHGVELEAFVLLLIGHVEHASAIGTVGDS
jgi:hypothetical protein